MRKKILTFLMLGFLSFGIVACGNDETSNKITNNTINNTIYNYQSVDNIEIKTNESASSVQYFYNCYNCLGNFYKSFYLISDSIEELDIYSFDIYFNAMLKEYNNAINFVVPTNNKDMHKSYLTAMDKYLIGTKALYDATSNGSLKEYKEAEELLGNALESLNTYSEFVANNFDELSDVFASLVQNEYYFTTITFYSEEESFSDHENEVLFFLSSRMANIPNLRNELLQAAVDNDGLTNAKENIEDSRKDLENLTIKDENIAKYRDDILVLYDIYIENLFNLADDLKENNIDKDKFTKYAENFGALDFDIYEAMQGISDFYETYNIDIFFNDTLQNIKDQLEYYQNQTKTNN